VSSSIALIWMPSSNPANAQIAEVAETRRLTQCCVRLFQYVLHIVAIRVIVFDMAASSRKSAAAILKDALRAESHESLAEHRETIEVLRGKDYSWRDIAQFLVERGVETDHTKIFRFMKQRGRIAMSPKVLVVP
jgi:tagatose-1,6-bisphosphate aldolase non-catalytic subunit AgaZ/GatZ